MSYSLEYRQHHLTPHGWETGTERVDFAETLRRDPPSDRVLTVVTVRWSEEDTSWDVPSQRGFKEVWRSPDEAVVKQLLDLFGPTPNPL